MKHKWVLACLILAVPLLACSAVTSLFPSQQNPKLFTGSIAIKGDGVLGFCSQLATGISCTGKTEIRVLPTEADFSLVTDNAGNFVSGRVQFDLNVDQNYAINGSDMPGFSGQLTGSSSSKYTGTIPLAAIGGPAASSAEYIGKLAENGNAQTPWQCEGESGDLTGSLSQTQGGVTLVLEGFSANMQAKRGGKCTFSVLDSLSSLLTSYTWSCTYGVEQVLNWMGSPTKSP